MFSSNLESKKNILKIFYQWHSFGHEIFTLACGADGGRVSFILQYVLYVCIILQTVYTGGLYWLRRRLNYLSLTKHRAKTSEK